MSDEYSTAAGLFVPSSPMNELHNKLPFCVSRPVVRTIGSNQCQCQPRHFSLGLGL